MPNTVFFSWQSDIQTKVGRNLIERALKEAAGRLDDDTTIEPAVRGLMIDRDTVGVPGSPPIADTIFRKIDQAAVFVPDLSFVGRRLDERPTPNPNVLIEYGWALKSLGHGRIVPVMNSAFGHPSADTMPFNLRHLRNPILYDCPPDANEQTRKEAREKLSKDLERAIHTCLVSPDFKLSISEPEKRAAFTRKIPQERAALFRRSGKRLGVADMSGADVFLEDRPAIWFRLLPETEINREFLVSQLKGAAISGTLHILPVTTNWGGFSYLRDNDGFGIYAGEEADRTKASAVVFCFVSGELWSIDTFLLDRMHWDGRLWIPDVEKDFSEALKTYADFLRKLGVNGKFTWVAGMENLSDRILSSKQPYQIPSQQLRRRCLADLITAEGLFSPGDLPLEALRPFFTKLYDACGVEWSGTLT